MSDYSPKPIEFARLGYTEKEPRMPGCIDYRNAADTHAIWLMNDGAIKLFTGYRYGWSMSQQVAREYVHPFAELQALLQTYKFPTPGA